MCFRLSATPDFFRQPHFYQIRSIHTTSDCPIILIVSYMSATRCPLILKILYIKRFFFPKPHQILLCYLSKYILFMKFLIKNTYILCSKAENILYICVLPFVIGNSLSSNTVQPSKSAKYMTVLLSNNT